jgi:hypothetical protein
MHRLLSILPAVFLTVLLVACDTTAPSQPVETPLAATEASSSVSSVADEPLPPVTYVSGVCGSEIPSTWHTRSAADQAVWNREGNIPPSAMLTADAIVESFIDRDAPLFKPAVFSMADVDTGLFGHTDDPGSEDPNRNEIDILRLSAGELTKLMDMLEVAPEEYAWDALYVGGHEVRLLKNTFEGGKYYGMQMYFVPANVTGGDFGLIIFNRSNDYDMQNAVFREGFHHFLSTLRFKDCPKEW